MIDFFEIKEYFDILSPEYPDWLEDYINLREMQRLDRISMLCATDYSPIFKYRSSNSTLIHSIAVALIMWHFTKNREQTLAGFFHDIATPAFKHCIDFMRGDSEHQESTEDRTEEIIKNSRSIMDLLERDGVKVEDVSNYKIYPIADNETPRLSADRFEYNFSNGLFLYDIWNLDEIKKCYDNVTILKNEDGIDELGFKDVKICEEYIHKTLQICGNYNSDNNRTVMQFFADITKSMNVKGYLSINDLYTLSEEQIINKILNCEDEYMRESFAKFQKATHVYGSDEPVQNKYCTSVKGKLRYVIPLVKCDSGVARIDKVSESAKKDIDEYFNIKYHKYTGFDFEFKPYEK